MTNIKYLKDCENRGHQIKSTRLKRDFLYFLYQALDD